MSLGPAIDALAAWLAAFGLPAWLAVPGATGLICLLPLLGFVVPLAVLGTMAERKVAAAMQRRLGPNQTSALGVFRLLFFFLPAPARQRAAQALMGLPLLRQSLQVLRRLGLVQLAADTAKTFAKEDLVPAGADALVFRAAPYLAVSGAFLAFAVLPFSARWVACDLSVGTVYVSGVTSLVLVGLVMAGWGSNNKWSLFGGVRAVAQIVSYEIPVALCIACVVVWCGSMSLVEITSAQARPGLLSFLGWNAFQHPALAVAALVFVIGSLAECNRTPFDLAEADSELVSGFNTEYSGMRWALFAMAEYVDMLLAGALLAVLFLGGYQSPIGEAWIAGLPLAAETAIHLAILLAKMMGVVAFFIWLRWTLPRLRMDQVMRLAWLRLVPSALACLLLTGLVAVFAAVRGWGAAEQAVAWAGGLAILGLLLLAGRARREPVHPAIRQLCGEAP